MLDPYRAALMLVGHKLRSGPVVTNSMRLGGRNYGRGYCIAPVYRRNVTM